jgi:hypothetical protein
MGYVYARCVSLEQGFRTMNVRIYRNLTSQDVKHIAYHTHEQRFAAKLPSTM